MKIVFLFPGQGSHYYQMGNKLMAADKVFRNTMLELDELSKSLQGISVVEKLYDPNQKLSHPFTSLAVTHPAIFMAEYALTQMLEANGVAADMVVGFSLGEFAAAVVAGALTPMDAMEMIIRQAREIERQCQPGGLIAVLDSPDLYKRFLEIGMHSTLASVNGPAQFVIAGEKMALEGVKRFLKARDILHQDLMIGYAFHSGGIDAAAASYCGYLRNRVYRDASLPWFSGISGDRMGSIAETYFWDVVRKPIAYEEAIRVIERERATNEELVFIDAGPAGSLANVVKYILPQAENCRAFQVMSPFQQEAKKLEELYAYCRPRRQPTPKAVPVPLRKDRLLAYVFPGQGSQRKGMGEGLFETFPELTARASEIVGYSMKDLCLSNPGNQLNQTQYTQPALFVVNALTYLKLKEDTGKVPDLLAGHSLGEYNALFAAGAMDFSTGVALVQKRGALMAKAAGGGMAAVKGLSFEQIGLIIRENGLEAIDIANQNSGNQVVLSGPKELIEGAGRYFTDAGATLYFVLNVSGAFHSRYMRAAMTEFAAFLRGFHFSPLTIPVVSNAEAAFYRDDCVADLLAEQLVQPVKWLDSVRLLLEQGEEVELREVGPGDVLTKLIYGIRRDLGVPVE